MIVGSWCDEPKSQQMRRQKLRLSNKFEFPTFLVVKVRGRRSFGSFDKMQERVRRGYCSRKQDKTSMVWSGLVQPGLAWPT